MNFKPIFAAVLLSTGLSAQVASWDSSGNAMLNGVYNFRQVIWTPGSQRGDLQDALSIFGTATFTSSTGTYTMSCQYLEVGRAVQTCPAIAGRFRINSGGIVRMDGPEGEQLDGLITNGVLMVSATENSNGGNDLLIAVKASDTAPGTGILNGRYAIGDFSLGTGSATAFRESLFSPQFDGNGGIENVQATGYISGNAATAVTQAINARYSFSAGIGTISFGGSLSTTNLIAGDYTIYPSPDGSMFFGGAKSGWDILIGIRMPATPAQTALSKGLYYQAGMDADFTSLAQNVGLISSSYSSFLANGVLLAGHRRLSSVLNPYTYDFTYTQTYSVGADGSYEDTNNSYRYLIGEGGRFQLGIAKSPLLGLNLAVRADFSGTGVYPNPGLVVNAASYAPSTAGVSPGEIVTIYGSGLATTTVSDGKFPPSLGGVIVLVNSRVAPIYSVSPDYISFQVPYATTEPIATISIVSNGQSPAPIVLNVTATAPGIFLQGDLKHPIAQHVDGSLVTTQKPATPGETIQVYMTGLGPVTPAINAGTPAPTDSLVTTSAPVTSVIDGSDAKVLFAGLTPGFIGLYQVNVTIPADATAGDDQFLIYSGRSVLASTLLPIAAAAGQ